MSNNLLLAPPPSHPQSYTNTPTLSAPSGPGLPDTLRTRNTTLTLPTTTASSTSTNPSQPSQQLQSSHPLERRLQFWRLTQQNLHATLLRRQYGIAAPIMRAMELNDVANSEAAIWLGGARGMGVGSVHGDVLRGEDWEIGGWEGVYGGYGDGCGDVGVGGEFHREMEGSLGMNW